MKRYLGLVLLAAILVSCVPNGVRSLQVHELLLYGLGERHIFMYGELEDRATREVKIEGQTVHLDRGPAREPLAVTQALRVDGHATARLPLASLGEPFRVSRVPLSNDFVITARFPLRAVVYYDGTRWVGLVAEVAAGSKMRVRTFQREGLRGLGQLSDAEADALARFLEPKGPLAIAVLAPEGVIAPSLMMEPTPLVYERTILAVQLGVGTDVLGGLTPSVGYRQLASGVNAAYAGSEISARLDQTPAEFAQTWALIDGNSVPGSPIPSVNFDQERVLSIFLGQHSSGGYGLRVSGVRLENYVLVVLVDLIEPGAGIITTQAITSPYVSVAVSGNFASVQVLDRATGRVLALI